MVLLRLLLLSSYCAYIIRKRTIFTCTANHLCEKEWVVTSNWTVEMEQELDALSHHMLMAAINSQLPSVLEYLDKCRCTLQLTQAPFMHFHKFDSKLPLWLSVHVSLRLQLSTIVREVSSVDRKERNSLRATITYILPGCMWIKMLYVYIKTTIVVKAQRNVNIAYTCFAD